MKNQHILYVVLAVTIILLIAIAYDSRHSATEEGFAMNGCQTVFGRKGVMMYGKKSTKTCCYGKVENGKCVGEGLGRNSGNQCSLGKKSGDIPECREFINTIKNDIKMFFCPKSMQNLFFSKTGVGCTDGPLNATDDGPLHPSSKQCTITIKNDQIDENDMNTNPNNCLVQATLENMQCIGSKCNKFIRKSPNNTYMIGMDFVSPDGLLLTCYNNYGTLLRESGMDHRKSMDLSDVHPMSCDVAKKLYVDKTIGTANIKLLP